MAPPFKIPKKKQTVDSDSSHLHSQSPLSRLQSSALGLKSYGDWSGKGGTDRVHAGSSSSSDRQSAPFRPLFSSVVKSLLVLNSPNNRGAMTANHRAAGSRSDQSQRGQRAESAACLSNGWRPKRASDRLLQPNVTSEPPSPPQKKKSGSPLPSKSISVESQDSLAEVGGERHAGSLSMWRRVHDAAEGKTSEEDFVSPCRTRNKPSADESPPRDVRRPSVSSVTLSPGATAGRRRSLDRTAWLKDDWQEKERQKWREFRAKTTSRSAVLHLRQRKHKEKKAEPIVLSSEEEEEEGGGGGGGRTSQSQVEESKQKQARSSRHQTDEHKLPPPSFMQLEFTSLHVGLMHADANGEMTITENGITIPLKGVEEDEVTVVASQVRGYGVWDGGVAQGGTLLSGWRGPAPSLFFLWVSDAQANLLKKELSSIQSCSNASGPSCCFLLLVLKEQLQELQAALLASILDMEDYRRGCSSSSSSSPLDWTDGLLLLHSCPPPLDQHLLRLLGRSRVKNQNLDSSGQQQLPTRVIQYPAAPSKGRITVTQEDLSCLHSGEFLNDVIIDFYLKYLLLEGVGGVVAQRSHVFSSFFYKQLSRRRAAGENDAPSIPDRHMRHRRVKTWTRHVDIFTKDFLFVPVNQEAHWYLVVVCFPGLEKVQYEAFRGPTGKPSPSLPSQQPPECLQQSCQRDRVLKRPCILVMDSLKLSYHENVCRLLRDYLQVEWEVRRGTPRLFTSDTMSSSNCRVPQQDNSSDCGLYLLQYAESFLQNPVVHFDLPLRLESWFPRQHVRQKREEIRSLILRKHREET